MTCNRPSTTWIVAVCLAVLAQGVLPPCCGGCDRACCGAAESLGGVADGVAAADRGHCPHCTAPVTTHQAGSAADERDAAFPDTPCRCRWEAGNDQPAAAGRSRLPEIDRVAPAPAPASVAVAADLEWGRGVSREYLATLLAAPIRPPRILYGVWRN